MSDLNFEQLIAGRDKTLFQHRILSAEEEVRLAKRIERGDKAAKDELILHNLRLVKQLSSRYHTKSLSPDDLFHEGICGLIRAAEKFDWRKGFKFSTYATWWIKQSIQRAIADKDSTVRIPVHLADLRRAIDRFEEQYVDDHGCRPSLGEIATAVDKPVDVVRSVMNVRNLVSLDTPVGEDGETRLGDLIADSSVDVDEKAEAGVNAILVARAMQVLSKRERLLLSELYLRQKPLSAVATAVGMTSEKARLVERSALRKLRRELGAKVALPTAA